ncbi:MAG TPA: M23 family metallopeptidase [Gemmatimonadaceae bacterium]
MERTYIYPNQLGIGSLTPRRRISRLRSWLGAITLVALLCVLVAIWIPVLRHPVEFVRLMTSSAPDSVRMPVMGVHKREIPNSWQFPRSGGRRHEGVDIFAKRGTPVLSATEGIVVRVGTNKLGGQVVNVLGPGRQVHYYAHLDRYGAFSAGDFVFPGNILGYVGNTGNARDTPPHLHYGIYDPVRGAINPWPLLR